MANKVLGILVGGGPAPGINSIISAVTIEAINNGYTVLGFKEGFQSLIDQDKNRVVSLSISDVSRIHFEGGSILRTSRANPTKKEGDLEKCVSFLTGMNVSLLVTIGGDDTAYSSMSLSNAAGNKLSVCHVPKTIDNDLPLPSGISTFGFQTAREFGTQIIRNLMTDAKTSSRYFIVIAMGRQAGHLALGIGKSAGAHLTLIPEEFGSQQLTMDNVCDMVESTVIKRLYQGKDHGVVVLAEGLLEKMSKQELKKTFGDSVKYDPHGHIQLADLDIGRVVRDNMRDRMKKTTVKLGFTEKNLGYELRCAPPNAFDREYTRDLGYGAVSYLLSGGNGALITFQGDRMVPMLFDDVKDPKTGKARIRNVSIQSEGFQVAVKYMIRLSQKDFEDPERIKQMAKIANLTPEQFREKFYYLVQTQSVHSH